VLGWSVKDTYSFSLPALRDMVRGKDDKLHHDISMTIEKGEHLIGKPIRRRRW
jgi:hypothetical protein